MRPGYRGRFAPSPTGSLHFGSLVAALASYADARHHAGAWLLRIDDLDQQRTLPGAADGFLATLEAFGFCWDEPPARQSEQIEAYEAALVKLRRSGQVYACGCSRREVRQLGRVGPEGPIYAGTCRNGLPAGRAARSERLRVDAQPISFDDRIQGQFSQALDDQVGDFVLRRADGFHAYQLAVVIDDFVQGITQVVRGADLLLSTPRQIYLQRLLGVPTPGYAHLPVALGADGRKLSKSHAALPVSAAEPVPALLKAWRFLGQAPLADPPQSVSDFWRQAIPHWNSGAVPRERARLAAPLPNPVQAKQRHLAS